MSGYLWAGLGLLTVLSMTVLRGMASEEIRDRLDHLPNAILRLAARRLTPSQRTTVYHDEWLPELTYILERAETRPITRLVVGTRYALGILISASRISHHLHRPLPQQIPGAAHKSRPDHYRQRSRRRSFWEIGYLRRVALADLGCAIVGVFAGAQLNFGGKVTLPYLILSLALPVVWIAALWLSGGYNVRFMRTGSDEFRKVLNAGVSLTAAVALFSYAINLELSRGYVSIVLPSMTLFALSTRYALRKRLRRELALRATPSASTRQNLPDQY